MALIIPKCNAEPETLDLTLQVYYNAKDWVSNADLIDRLSKKLYDAGIETEKKEPQSYTKKTQVLSYYGLIEWEDPSSTQSRRRISENGIKFYELRQAKDQAGVQALLVDILESNTFGRNVLGCDSDSDLEAPNIFIKSALLLGNLTNKEFAYILGRLELDRWDFADTLFDVLLKRKKGIPAVPNEASAKWADPKPIIALADWGLFDTQKENNTKLYFLNGEVINNLGDKLAALRIKNTDVYNPIYSKGVIKDEKVSLASTYAHYLTALRTKPFMLLAGISGTSKSRIVRKLAQSCVTEDLQRQYDSKSIENGFDRWQLHKPANFELVQVKPNWHNSLEVVGYKSNIGGAHYEFTPFVRFVARAWQHQDIPFFLCLDEMNLAPVEQYFAEFLSAIESRSMENGLYETDPIIKPFCEFNATDSKGNVTDNLADRMIAELLGRLDTQTKSDLAERFRTKGLTLPKNLFVLGTVNMDETTFSFSRKVLDRAMSIVMNEVKYDQFFTGDSENDMDEMSAETMQLLIDREIRGVQAEQNDSDTVENYLSAINGILDNTPFKLGYRAANEALLYVSATHLMSDKKTEDALDEFTMMKILSRIEGDKRSVDTILTDLQEVITEAYPKSNKKLKDMADTLKNKQFVSYWN